MTALAVAIGVASGVIGVVLSRAVDIAAGGAIVLTLAAVFVLSVLLTDGGPVRRRTVAATTS
jgi:manganese/iron transport system permease protein